MRDHHTSLLALAASFSLAFAPADAPGSDLVRRPLSKPGTTNAEILNVISAPLASERIWDLERRPNADGTVDFVFSWAVSADDRDQLLARPPVAVDVIVQGGVRRQGTGSLVYEYGLSNLRGSSQDLFAYVVEVPQQVTPIEVPDGGWAGVMRVSRFGSLELSSGILWADAAAVTYPRRGIKPGGSARPFGVQSDLYPGVVRCFAWGYVPILGGAKGEVPPDVIDAASQISHMVVAGKTVGPIEMPTKVEDYLARLLELNAECQAEGWVVPSVAGEASAAIKAALTRLAAGEPAAAGASLADFCGRLEILKASGQLLDEAYAILKLNIEHLEEMLKQQ